MSDMVKYRVVSLKKDQVAALYFTMSDIVHVNRIFFLWKIKMAAQSDLSILKFELLFLWSDKKSSSFCIYGRMKAEPKSFSEFS